MADANSTRQCRRCNRHHPIAHFRPKTNGRDHTCRACRAKSKVLQNRASLLKSYGIDETTYCEMLEGQGNRCAICQTSKPGGPWDVFAVDHCHKTNKIRGLLCTKCNVGLGKVGDDLDGIMRFVRYLEAAECKRADIVDPRSLGRSKPYQKSVVRYLAPNGRQTKKGHPGATPVRQKSSTYYIHCKGREHALKTTDLEEAWRRAIKLFGPPSRPRVQPQVTTCIDRL